MRVRVTVIAKKIITKIKIKLPIKGNLQFLKLTPKNL